MKPNTYRSYSLLTTKTCSELSAVFLHVPMMVADVIEMSTIF